MYAYRHHGSEHGGFPTILAALEDAQDRYALEFPATVVRVYSDPPAFGSGVNDTGISRFGTEYRLSVPAPIFA